jgi:DNA-binding NtrC family response regulator
MLIADVMMPGESGLHLSAFAETLGVPSLLVSGELTTKEKLKDNYAFIGKPFRLQEITEYIRRVLAKPEGDVHDSLVQIQRWRMKAEEIRTAADGFADGSAREALLNSAQTYEALANAGEAGLRRRRPETSP